MRDSNPHQHKTFPKIPTVRSPLAALALQRVFGSTQDREFPIANSGSILTHKASTPTRHAMDDSPRFLHRLAPLQRHHPTSNRRISPGASSPSRLLAAPSTPSTQIILRRAPLYGFSRTELHRAVVAASSPLVTRRIKPSRRPRRATPSPQ